MTEAAAGVAPLRAIDWRFLLPVPPGRRASRLLILGGPPGIIARSTRAGLAEEVVSAIPTAESADVVAVYADAPQSIADICAALSHGGFLYLEVDRRRRGVRASTPRRIQAILRDAGLSVCAFYGLEPEAHEARAFIPLDAPLAMSWHRRISFGDHAGVRVANAVRQPAVRLGGPTLAALDRPYAVIATRGKPAGAAPGVLRDPNVLDRLGATREPAATLMLTYGSDRVLFFPFSEGSRDPIGVVKVPKADTLAGRTENEQAQMRALRQTLDASLAAAIPEPLGVVPVNGTAAACERVMPGASIAARAMDPKRSLDEKISDLRMAVDWLARFHNETEVRRATIRQSRTDLVDALIESYECGPGATAEPALFRRVHELVNVLGAERITIAIQHRDFAAWNVLRSGERISVVDWEGAREGFAAFDAVHLATTWLYSARLGEGVDDETRCVHELLGAVTTLDRAATAARDALDWYLKSAELGPRVAPLLITLHRVELAIRRADQLRLQDDAAAEGQPSMEVGIVRSLGAVADRLVAAVAT